MRRHQLALIALMYLSTFLYNTVLSEEISQRRLNDSIKIDAQPALFAILSLLLGLVLCFFGYRMYFISMYFCNLGFGGLLAYILASMASNSSPQDLWIAWFMFYIVGLSYSIFHLFYLPVGIFSIGALAGALISILLNTSFFYLSSPSNPNLPGYILFPLFSLAGGALSFHYEKPVLIVSMSLIGAFAFTWGAGYFAGNFPNGLNLNSDNTSNVDIPIIWYAFYLPFITILTLGGQYIQLHYTAKHSKPKSQLKEPAYVPELWGTNAFLDNSMLEQDEYHSTLN